jgi:SAM-dependent methyltransferase
MLLPCAVPVPDKSSYRTAGEGRPPRRALALIRVGDLRSTDHVLDVGCGDGEVALEVAGLVERLHGVDIRGDRVQRAVERAAERGIPNASFETWAIQKYPLEPSSWDVTLFMRVWGKGTHSGPVQDAELERVLAATRRQAILQAGKRRWEQRLQRIFAICDQQGFDAAWFVELNLIVANRRGAGARIGALPERVAVSGPGGVRLVPTASVPNHPIVRSYDPKRRTAA